MNVSSIVARIVALWEQAMTIGMAGGWAMPAIGAVALAMAALSIDFLLRFGAKGFHKVPERRWREWIDQPDERRGALGELFDHLDSMRTVKECGEFFTRLRALEIVPFERDLRIVKVCVGAAPLLGLLGTVTGMLVTFGALASGSGGEKTMALIAEGISEALITTETGLVVALPGLFIQYLLARRIDRMKKFLAHLETVWGQTIHRRTVERRRAAAPSNQSGHQRTAAAASAH